MKDVSPSTHKPVLILPIELIQRELDGKLLLALEAVQRGYQVIIGEHERLNRRLKRLPLGAYLYKDAASWQAAKLFPRLKAEGHRVLALDEEGLIFASEELYLRSRVDEQAVANLDVLFAWGQVHRRVLLEKPNMPADIIKVTGNPRLDLCRLLSQPTPKRAKFVVLVNTRFALINGHKPAEQVIESLRRLKVISNSADEAFFGAFMQRDKPLLQAFIDAVRALAALGDDVHVIVRPHPAESSELYRDAFSRLANVVVDNDTPLTRHIAESDILLHEGCTTAIEAALMGKPSVALALTPPLSEPQGLPNTFSHPCHSAREAVDYIDACRQGTIISRPNIGTQAQHALENASGRYAFQLIMDAVDAFKLAPQSIAGARARLARGQRLKSLRLTLKRLFYIELLPRLLNKSATDISRRSASFANKHAKFPALDQHSLAERVATIAELYPQPVNYRITQIDSQTFQLSAKD